MAIRSSIFMALLAIGLGGASTRALGAPGEPGQVDPTIQSGERDSKGTAAATRVLPANVNYPERIRPVLDRMWRSSPTFRRQCARLSEARDLTVVFHVGVLPADMPSLSTAFTRIETRSGRPVRANVWLSLSNLEQHIAHELEHIIERIDGVHVELMAARSMHGVQRHDRAFETARAKETGRTVAREVMTRHAMTDR